MTAIALLQINPLALPSLPLEWRKALPECPGVYPINVILTFV